MSVVFYPKPSMLTALCEQWWMMQEGFIHAAASDWATLNQWKLVILCVAIIQKKEVLFFLI